MFRIEAPILVVPTAEAKEALGSQLRIAALAAYREIALAAKGLEIAHLQFAFRKLTLAVCSRVRRDGIVEIRDGSWRSSPAEEFVHRCTIAAGGGRCPGTGQNVGPPRSILKRP
jgi:hypothetical protein